MAKILGKVPTAIMLSGVGSNAIRLIKENSPNLDIRVIFTDTPTSKAEDIAKGFGIDFKINSFYDYCGINSPDNLTDKDKLLLKDMNMRRVYDSETFDIFKKYGIELVAAAGYDLYMTRILTFNFLIVNVHPGDLRRRDALQRPLYTGLGWVPTAKAILNGEEYAHTSTHLITPRVHEGPVARVSSPVLINLPQEYNKDNILPLGVSLQDVIDDIDYNRGKIYGEHILYTHSRAIQFILKERGDWVEFPLTMHMIAKFMLDDRFSRTAQRELYLDGRKIPNGFLMGVDK